jgi:hypothetical protein
MGTLYDGIPGNIAFSTPLSILGSTNTNPITITVSGGLPADFLTGVQVDIQGHQINTAANGVRVATVTGGSTFTIPVAGIGNGVATGTVTPLNMTGNYSIPADGDLDNEASIDSWAKATGDRTQFLAGATGAYKLAMRMIASTTNSGTPPVIWASFAAGAVTSGQKVQLVTQAGPAWGTNVGTAVTLPVAGQAPTFAVDGMATGDHVIVTLDTNIITDTSARIELWGAQNTPGNIPPWPAGYAQLGASSKFISPVVESAPTIKGFINSISAGLTTFWFQPIVHVLSSSTQSYTLTDDATVIVEFWRPTKMPQ